MTLKDRAQRIAIGLDRASGGFKTLQGEYPALRELELGELFALTADIIRELLAKVPPEPEP